MIRKRFSSDEISDIVMKLIGEIEPVGETNTDDRRYSNLLLLLNTVDILLDEIQFVMPYKDRVEYSMKRAGEEAERWLYEKQAWVDDLLREER